MGKRLKNNILQSCSSCEECTLRIALWCSVNNPNKSTHSVVVEVVADVKGDDGHVNLPKNRRFRPILVDQTPTWKMIFDLSRLPNSKNIHKLILQLSTDKRIESHSLETLSFEEYVKLIRFFLFNSKIWSLISHLQQRRSCCREEEGGADRWAALAHPVSPREWSWGEREGYGSIDWLR